MRSTLVVLSMLVASAGLASDAKPDLVGRYEEQLISASMVRRDLRLDPAPIGKIIEEIIVDASTVLQATDFAILRKIPVLSGYPALNRLHVRTRDHVIAREMLIKVGEIYAADRVLESGRNLRSLGILAVARIVAVRGSTPDRVRLLIVTKDKWSLRLNTDFSVDQARLDSFYLSVQEDNLAGRNKSASLVFSFDPGRYVIGAGYVDPRVWGSRISTTLGGSLYLRRTDGVLEGGAINVSTGLPLFSLRSKWAWGISGSYSGSVVRIFQGANLRGIRVGDEIIPIVYRRESWNVTVSGTRSWGLIDKLNLSWGFSVGGTVSELNDATAGFSDEARAALTRILPRSERATGPYLLFEYFRAKYIQLRNINTFALTEDFRVGPSARAQIFWAAPYFGLESHFLELSARFGYTHFWRDNLLSYSVSGAMRVQTNVVVNSPLANEQISAGIREITPRFGPFRLHVAGSITLRNHDLNNTLVEVGASSGLRGYPTRAFIGNNAYLVNVELRTLPLNLWTIHIGGVIFYDAGDAPASLLTMDFHQNAGVGVRILLPQFNREVIRLDVAFPFEYTGSYAPRFSAEFRQAF